MGEGEGRWNLRLLRDGGADGYSFQLGRAELLLAVGVPAAVLLVVGAGVGYWWGRSAGGERVRALQRRVERLEGQRREVRRLASRLDSVARAYGRVREAVIGAERDGRAAVRLPAPPARDVSAEDGDGTGAAGLPPGWPLGRAGFVTRRFGEAGFLSGESHPGMDIAVPVGSYIRAAGRGRVAGTGRDSVYGRFVRVVHPRGYASVYAHAAWITVQPGDSVRRGEVIGLSGNTGRSTAPHLHVEVLRNGVPVDPLSYFRSQS